MTDPTDVIEHATARAGSRDDTTTMRDGTGRNDTTSVRVGMGTDSDATLLAVPRARAPDVRERAVPDVPTKVTARRRHLGVRAAVIGLGGLAVVAMAIFYWRPEQPPVSVPVPPATLSPGPRPAEPPPERSAAEDLRRRMMAAHERAEQAEAASLASDAFSEAQARAAEGDRLAAAQNLAAAAQAYTKAAERYGTAERQAQTKRAERVEADTARERMVAAKQRARRDTADFAAALVHERQGNSMYEQVAFTEAATSFRAAADLFGKVPPAQDPRAEIRALLNQYVRAVETKDLAALRRVLTDDEQRRVIASFEITRSRKVDLRVYQITVTGDEAQAQGRREDLVVLNSGQRLQTETGFAYTLKRGPRGWVIQGLREPAEKPVRPRAPGSRDS